MPRLLSVLSPGLAALLLVACRPPAYVQPTPTEPHAILKIRHVVHQRGGPLYSSTVRVGRFAVDERTLDPAQEGADTIHLRIHPRTDAFAIGGTSFHHAQQLVTRYRTVQESYSCPEQQCSGGYGSTSRSCHTSYRTCYRSRQVPYQEWQTVEVTDDSCSRSFPFTPTAGSTYLLQFDYLGENECQLACYEQVQATLGDGFQLVPGTPATVTAAR